MKFKKMLASVKYFGLRKLWYIGMKITNTLHDMAVDSVFFDHPQGQSLIKRRLSRILIEDYNGDSGHNTNQAQYFIGFGIMHYAIIRNIKPKRVLCIGSRRGYIPAILALACKDNHMGHVDFVDAGYDQDLPDKHWGGVGFWKKYDAEKHFGRIGLNPYITTHVTTTEEFAKKYSNRRYQYVYVDGDHSYEGVLKDYTLFWPKVDSGGFMAFHDVVARGHLDKGVFGVAKLWNRIKKKHAITFPFPFHSGLGIIQK